MANLLRTLIFDKQVSLTLADTTQMVKKAVALHKLTPASAEILGKTLSAMTFMSACLKGDLGEISLSLKTDGNAGEIGVSGNRRLFMRGFIENTKLTDETEAFGQNGSLTIIRDDGYARPFVGACQWQAEGVDKSFEEYFRISEQLPTYIATQVGFNEKGEVAFAGVAVLQPLPFADEATLAKTRSIPLYELLKALREQGIQKTVEGYFPIDKTVWEEREAKYKCNCSRAYLTRVLVTLGNEQMSQIIKEDGAVRVHCHYCNRDYEFTDEDRRKIFREE